MKTTYDTIIIGAGIMGSATAYFLSKQGQRVLLLEQYELTHKKGSSNDHTRIIRYSYDHADYVRLAKPNYALWEAVQAEAQEQLLYKAGGIDFGTPDQPYIQNMLKSADQTGLVYETLTPRDAEKQFPQFRFNDDMTILYQAESGVLAAGKCVQVFQKLAKKQGLEIHDNSPVTEINVTSSSVEITTPNETFQAGNLVITAGAWSKKALKMLGLDMPLIPTRCQVTYFKPEDLSAYEHNNLPVFIAHVPSVYDEFFIYGIPSVDGCGVKIGLHGGQRLDDPSQINYTPDDEIVTKFRNFAQDHLPDADIEPFYSRICPYTMTPDEHFIIDIHPTYKNVAFGAGFSGHGFKFGAIVGEILADLTTKQQTDHDISLFSASRFL